MKRFTYILLCIALQAIIPSSLHATQDLPPSVAPLLPDQWDQEGALKRMTPVIDGEHAVVGCVGLAMAQVMHYWKYPERGTGSLTYTDSTGCGQTLTANFGEHVYEWDKMLNIYKEGEYTEEQAAAGALLCSDCGISVKTTYGTSASGAQTVMQAIALPQYFGYDEGVQLYFRDFYTKAEITQMLKTELAAGRPILATGYNYNGGHAFVIDGYDESDRFHINLGNPDGPDDGDGWTPLDYMAPNQPQWYDPDSPESGLNILQIFVMGIQPATHPTATRQENHVFAMSGMEPLAPTADDLARTVRLCTRNLSNIGRSLHNDSVSIVLATEDGSVISPLYTYEHQFLLEEIDDTTYTDTLDIQLPADITEGTYRIQPMYRDNGVWTAVRTVTGTPNYLLANISSGIVTLQGDTANTAYVTLEDFDIPDLIINGTIPEMSLTLKNHNAEISGRLLLLMEPLDDDHQPFYLIRQGVTMQKDELSVRNFHKTSIYAPKTGTYRLRILFSSNLFEEDFVELYSEYLELSVLSGNIMQLARVYIDE